METLETPGMVTNDRPQAPARPSGITRPPHRIGLRREPSQPRPCTRSVGWGSYRRGRDHPGHHDLSGPDRTFSNLWVIRLAADGRCREFTEWWMDHSVKSDDL